MKWILKAANMAACAAAITYAVGGDGQAARDWIAISWLIVIYSGMERRACK